MFFKRKKPKIDSLVDASITHSSQRGFLAEKQAGKYLKHHGLNILQYNYYCRFGEIDLIAKDKTVLVFVEVKLRKENAQVSALESISASKQHKLRKTAEHYLQKFEVLPDCRFDVVAMTHKKNRIQEIEWLKSCF